MTQLLLAPPPKRQVLRPYQARSLEDCRELLRSGVQRILLVSPTGSGKTTIAAEMIHGAVARGGAVLFLAHRRELIDQCSERLYQTSVPHGIVMAQHPRADAGQPVQVASVQTLTRRLDHLPRATLIVVDEAHHARAEGYERILQAYPGVPVVGLSATPWRLDGRGLGEMFQRVVVAATVRELIEQGHLVSFTGYAYDSPDLAGVKKSGGDYNTHGLELVVGGNAKLAGNIVEQWQLHAAGKRTVVFAVSVAHSQELVTRFRAAGVTAEHVDGEMDIRLRAAALRRLTAGETQVICNVNVLTEGWDCPALEVVVLARPTLSQALYLQMVGRPLRPFPGKAVARIHDHAGCVLRHGLPDAARDYSLSTDKRKPKTLALRTCPKCFAVFETWACPVCGEAPKQEQGGSRQAPKEIAGEAIPLEQLAEQMQLRLGDEKKYLAELQARATANGYDPKWVGIRFKQRYGHWPAGLRPRRRSA